MDKNAEHIKARLMTRHITLIEVEKYLECGTWNTVIRDCAFLRAVSVTLGFLSMHCAFIQNDVSRIKEFTTVPTTLCSSLNFERAHTRAVKNCRADCVSSRLVGNW